MEIIDTIETAAGTVAAAIEQPFHTIGARLKAAGEHLAAFLPHPYAAPPLQDVLTTLHGIVVDLHQEVAELRVPCPCKTVPTSAAAAASLALAPNFKDRAKAEAEDLLKKRTALGYFIQSAAFDSVLPAEQQRLIAQAAAMTDYQVALQARIDADFGA